MTMPTDMEPQFVRYPTPPREHFALIQRMPVRKRARFGKLGAKIVDKIEKMIKGRKDIGN